MIPQPIVGNFDELKHLPRRKTPRLFTLLPKQAEQFDRSEINRKDAEFIGSQACSTGYHLNDSDRTPKSGAGTGAMQNAPVAGQQENECRHCGFKSTYEHSPNCKHCGGTGIEQKFKIGDIVSIPHCSLQYPINFFRMLGGTLRANVGNGFFTQDWMADHLILVSEAESQCKSAGHMSTSDEKSGGYSVKTDIVRPVQSKPSTDSTSQKSSKSDQISSLFDLRVGDKCMVLDIDRWADGKEVTNKRFIGTTCTVQNIDLEPHHGEKTAACGMHDGTRCRIPIRALKSILAGA